MSQRLLEGKKGVILGVANKRSLAWGIAKAASEAGARLAFTYQGEKFKDKVEELAGTLEGPCPLYSCDVTSGADIVDDVFHPTKLLYDDPRVLKAIGLAQDLLYKYNTTPSTTELQATGVSAHDLFAAGRVAIGTEVRIVLDAAPQYVIPANVSFVADVAQFTPKAVETANEREKLMFRVRAQIPPELLKKYILQVKTGLPGVAYVLSERGAKWPDRLQVKLPQ